MYHLHAPGTGPPSPSPGLSSLHPFSSLGSSWASQASQLGSQSPMNPAPTMRQQQHEQSMQQMGMSFGDMQQWLQAMLQQGMAQAVPAAVERTVSQMKEDLTREQSRRISDQVEEQVAVRMKKLQGLLMERVDEMEEAAKREGRERKRQAEEHEQALAAMQRVHGEQLDALQRQLDAAQAELASLQAGLEQEQGLVDDELLQRLAGSLLESRAGSQPRPPCKSTNSASSFQSASSSKPPAAPPTPPRSAAAAAAAATSAILRESAAQAAAAAAAGGGGGLAAVHDCPFACGAYFVERSDLEVHMLAEHGEDMGTDAGAASGSGSTSASASQARGPSMFTKIFGNAMQIVVKAPGGKQGKFPLPRSCTLATVRSQISEAVGIPADKQMILVGGKAIKKTEPGSKQLLDLLPPLLRNEKELSMNVSESMGA